MRYSLAALLAIVLASPVSASLQIETPFTPMAPLGINDFATQLGQRILSPSVVTPWVAVADVIATEAGTLRFFAHASESGFTNTFHINDTLGNPYSYTEVGAVTGWDDPLVPFAEFDVPLNTTFSSLLARFTTNGTPPASTPGVDANIGEIGFGIFVASNGDYDPFHLYFAYDDNGAGPDDNHDDLIVSVQFVPGSSTGTAPVPEPISFVVWGALVGATVVLPAVSRRR